MDITSASSIISQAFTNRFEQKQTEPNRTFDNVSALLAQTLNETDTQSSWSGSDESTRQMIDDQMAKTNQQLQSLGRNLRFERDADTDKIVLYIRDTQTDEVVRQIPSEVLLSISKRLSDYLQTYGTDVPKSPPNFLGLGQLADAKA